MINLNSNRAVYWIEKTNIKLEKLKVELEQETRYKVQALILRSRVKWVEMAEKNTKYFYSLEKFKVKSKGMNMIVNSQGKLIYEQSEILKEQKNFYQ